MPFQAQCVFCGHQMRVPDHAYGASGRCPKCTCSFTLVPAESANARPARGPGFRRRAAPKKSAVLPASPIQSDPRPAPVAAPASFPVPAPIAQAAILSEDDYSLPEERPPVGPHWIDPVGFVALVAGGAALWCSSTARLSGFVIPLSVVAALVGLAGLLLAPGRVRLLIPVTGTALGGLVFLIAVFSPDLLGPVYRFSRQRDTTDPTAVRVVPLPGKGNEAIPTDPEWVDASRAALQQGRMRVQVIGATIVSGKAKSSAETKGPTEPSLLLRLRTQRVQSGSELAEKSPPRREPLRPRLTDGTGKAYQQRDSQEVGATNPRKEGLFPVAYQDEVFVFEAPAEGLGSLRLEIPADAWGGKGALRFTIPSALIRSERAGSVGPGGLPGGK
jgi:hypothetical protein